MAANSRFAMATHIMASLAFEKEESLSSSHLGGSLNTNPVVVRRILGDLQKAGLVETTAGKSGGARLAKKPAQISLHDIYMAVDHKSLFAYNPNDPNKHCPLSCKMKSVLEPIFHSASEALARDLRKVKLSDLEEQLSGKGSAAKKSK